jgi:hypothetical protein
VSDEGDVPDWDDIMRAVTGEEDFDDIVDNPSLEPSGHKVPPEAAPKAAESDGESDREASAGGAAAAGDEIAVEVESDDDAPVGILGAGGKAKKVRTAAVPFLGAAISLWLQSL